MSPFTISSHSHHKGHTVQPMNQRHARWSRIRHIPSMVGCVVKSAMVDTNEAPPGRTNEQTDSQKNENNRIRRTSPKRRRLCVPRVRLRRSTDRRTMGTNWRNPCTIYRHEKFRKKTQELMLACEPSLVERFLLIVVSSSCEVLRNLGSSEAVRHGDD